MSLLSKTILGENYWKAKFATAGRRIIESGPVKPTSVPANREYCLFTADRIRRKGGDKDYCAIACSPADDPAEALTKLFIYASVFGY